MADPVVIVTVILAFATFSLYWEATRQSGISKLAADAATAADSLTQISFMRDSVRYSKSIERDSFNNARIAYDDSVKFKKQSDLATRSLEIQAASIRETQQQFELSHRPFLRITDVRVDSIEENQSPSITFNLSNSGQFPAELVYTSLLLGFGNTGGDIAKLIKKAEDSEFKTICRHQQR